MSKPSNVLTKYEGDSKSGPKANRNVKFSPPQAQVDPECVAPDRASSEEAAREAHVSPEVKPVPTTTQEASHRRWRTKKITTATSTVLHASKLKLIRKRMPTIGRPNKTNIGERHDNKKLAFKFMAGIACATLFALALLSPVCAADISRFGFSLFSSVIAAQSEKQGQAQQSNVLVSPFGVAQALALVAAGSTPSSDCRTELLSALGAESHQSIPALAEAAVRSSSAHGVTLTTANSIWTKLVKKDYVTTARTVHRAEALDLPSTYRPINEWVGGATDGMITDLFDESQPVDPLARAILVNAVHFKGSWADRFDEAMTTDGEFHPTEVGEQLPCRFMRARRNMEVAASVEGLGGASVLRLDYGAPREDGAEDGPDDDDDPEFCAVLVLPTDGTQSSMDDAISGLASRPLGETLEDLRMREVDLSLPRFRVEWGAESIKPALRLLGIDVAFDGRKVFSQMSDDPDLHLDDVVHKTAMEVTEEGTVAAAATGAVMMTRSIAMPPPPLVLRFDRPFVVAVVHLPTGTPLFLGKIVTPDLVFESTKTSLK